jgi:hypothetical protein
MRRIFLTVCPLAVLSLTVFYTLGAQVSPKPKAKGKAPAAAATYGNADSISEAEMKIYDYFLASDQLEGRNLPSRGYDVAALYVASHLAEWGLKPGGSMSKTDGPMQPYFIPMELSSRQVLPEESKASLTAPAPAGGGGRGGGGAVAPAEGASAASGAGGRGGRGGRGGGGRGASGGGRTAGGGVTTEFEYGKDWTTAGGGGRGGPQLEPTMVDGKPAVEFSGSMVFVGNGYVINKGTVNKDNVNPFEGVDVKGKIVVIAGVPAEIAATQGAGGRGGRGGAGGAAGASGTTNLTGGADGAAGASGAGGRGAAAGAAVSPFGEACKDFMTPEQAAAKNGAVGVVTIPSFTQLAAMANGGAAGRGGRGGAAGLNGPAFTVTSFQRPAACPSAPSVTAGIELANAIFQGEKHDASAVFYAGGANGKLEAFALNEAKKLNIHIGMHVEQGHGEDVVGIVEGSDPVLKNEYIIMSAHLDHIGLSAPLPDGHNVNNGADDDGSGSSALLAMARVYAEGAAKGMRPKRSMIFLWNAGEEKGLWGSQYFNEFPSIDMSKVVADLNIDMIGRTKGPGYSDPDPTHVLVNHGEVMIIGPEISSSDMEKRLEAVNNDYQKLTLNHFYDTTAPDATHDNLGPQPRGQRIFYRSDHYNFAKMGIPIIFFTTGLHPDYHRPTDTPDKIDYKEMEIVSKTVAALAWQLGTQDSRPELNSKLPDQLVTDMKAAKDQGWGKVAPVLPPLPHEPF